MCERSSCVRKHHTPLHPPDGARGHNDVDSRAVSHQASATASGRKRVCLRVIPVRVQGLCNGRIIETYALLDDGSDVSLCDQRLSTGEAGFERDKPAVHSYHPE